MLRSLPFVWLLLLQPGIVQADAFKCVDAQGRVSFTQVPCTPDRGTATWAASTARTVLTSVNPDDADPRHINEKATEILRSGYNVKHHYKVVLIPQTGPPPVKPELPKPRPAFEACNSAANARYCSQ